jgi:tRNA (cytidine56-2'-O)-methyltransferase
MMNIHILRLNHRPSRDKRLTTHLFLAARALGAKGGAYTGIRDITLEQTIRDVVNNWGGDFTLKYGSSWRNMLSNWEGRTVHLTMYGLPIQNKIDEIIEDKVPKLVIVGGPKVPGDIYSMVDWNIAITNQPHSEVSALAIFLHELLQGKELVKDFPNANLRIIPKEHNKLVVRKQNNFESN